MENNRTTIEGNETTLSEARQMTEDFTGLYEIRDYTEADKNFVMATFLRGLYYGDSWFSKIPKQVFMDNYKLVAEHLLTKSVVKIACLPEDPEVIIGYSILSADYSAIEWVYVKKAWRLKGIGRRLVPKYPTAVTHLSKLGESLLSKFENTIFNPFYNL